MCKNLLLPLLSLSTPSPLFSLPARRYGSAGTSCGPVFVSVCLSVCLSQVGVLSKRVGGLSWFFWHVGFFQPVPHCGVRKFRYLQK